MIVPFHMAVWAMKHMFASTSHESTTPWISEEKVEEPEEKENKVVSRPANESDLFGEEFAEIVVSPEEKSRARRRRGSHHLKKEELVRAQKRKKVRDDLDAFFRYRILAKRQRQHDLANAKAQSEAPNGGVPGNMSGDGSTAFDPTKNQIYGKTPDFILGGIIGTKIALAYIEKCNVAGADGKEAGVIPDDVTDKEMAAVTNICKSEIRKANVIGKVPGVFQRYTSGDAIPDVHINRGHTNTPDVKESIANLEELPVGNISNDDNKKSAISYDDVTANNNRLHHNPKDDPECEVTGEEPSPGVGVCSSVSNVYEQIGIDGDSGYMSNLSLDLTDQPSQTQVGGNCDNRAIKDGIIPNLTFVHEHGVICRLGGGAFGNVYKAQYHNEAVAVKVITMKPMCDVGLYESQVHNAIGSHPGIIEIQANYSVHNKYEGIVMELAPATVTDLVNKIKDARGSSTEANLPVFDPCYGVYFTSCVAQAISHLHEKNIVHLDINSSNVLMMASGVPKLAGFSSSTYWSSDGTADLSTYPVGTEGFRAPEIMLERGYNSSADWFAFGALLTYICLGRLPWGTSKMAQLEMLDTNKLMENGLNGDLFHQHQLGLTLILLQVDKEERMTSVTRSLLDSFHNHELASDPLQPPQTTTLEFIQTRLFN